jgi:hypothetical protein
MPIDQAISPHKDIRAISRALPTNAVIARLKKIEAPIKTRGIHPIDSYIQVGQARRAQQKCLSTWTASR